ncbi:MAG: nucleotide sugar dehydrogenase [Firmicutes bacterium]|nr:nucleotide sugar dehydrogenase [Bacillota bacterium]
MEAVNNAKLLKEKILNHTAAVAVIGLGYVGLPMAIEQARRGFRVVGVDRDEKKVAMINNGQSYIRDVPGEVLRPLVEQGRLRALNSYEEASRADIMVICVPTPLKSMQPDLSCITSAAGEIAGAIRPGRLVCLESTTFPGTTEEIVLPALEATGLVVGRDFFLAFSPERIDPGNKQIPLREIAKVVGGVTPQCRDLACAFYARVFSSVIPVSSPAAAEMTKIYENTYRSVNIALVNEFMLLCDKMGLDVWEILDAAATKPFGIQIFYPGPGVGGHCIPVDPVYLAWKARAYQFPPRFIELAAELNNQATEHVMQKITAVLNDRGKCLKDAKVLVLGVAYKKDIDDVRESPALRLIELLLDKKADVKYYDPHVPQIILPAAGGLMQSVPPACNHFAGADIVLIITDHSCVDYQQIVTWSRLVIDTRNATRLVTGGREKIIKI